MNKGMLYWVTGLSGAGKTTVGTMLYQYLKSKKDNVLMLDGDAIRAVMEDHDFSEEGRDRTAWRNLRLFKLLTDQGIDVICCVIGMKEAYRAWGRQNIENFCEVYLKVSIEELIRRDSKGLYQKALNHEIDHVYGIDLPFEEPKMPHVLIENEGITRPEDALQTIISALNL